MDSNYMERLKRVSDGLTACAERAADFLQMQENLLLGYKVHLRVSVKLPSGGQLVWAPIKAEWALGFKHDGGVLVRAKDAGRIARVEAAEAVPELWKALADAGEEWVKQHGGSR